METYKSVQQIRRSENLHATETIVTVKFRCLKLGSWFVLWSFFLLRLLHISTNLPYCLAWNTVTICMEYCCHVWFGAPSCYLKMLDNLQKRRCKTVAPLLSASLKPLAHRPNVARLSLFYRYYFDRCLPELADWFHIVVLEGGLLVILVDCMIFLSPFLDVVKMSMSTVSFLA